jgi:hypothetical protein
MLPTVNGNVNLFLGMKTQRFEELALVLRLFAMFKDTLLKTNISVSNAWQKFSTACYDDEIMQKFRIVPSLRTR